MKVLKILSHITLTLLFVAYIAYQFRTDPIMILSGKQLSGDEMSYPTDWSFTNDHMTIFVETRVGNPHSVTTLCFVHEGDLYIPAAEGSTKAWPQYVLSDARVRLKVGDDIYPAAMKRVAEVSTEVILASLIEKYPQYAETPPEERAKDVWLFRVSGRQ